MWLHVNNCCKGAMACLCKEGGITGIMFCRQTGGPIEVGELVSGRAYNRDFTI